VLRCTLVLYFGEHTSCYVALFCCGSVNTLFMLRCTLLLYVGDNRHVHCTFFSTSVTKLHVTLAVGGGVGWVGWGGVITSWIHVIIDSLRWPNVMLRCILLLYMHTFVVHRWTHVMLRCTFLLNFGEHASCYVATFCCNYFGDQTSCYVSCWGWSGVIGWQGVL